MNDRTHLIPALAAAAKYGMLQDVFLRDPAIGPDTAEIMRDIFRMGQEPDHPDERDRAIRARILEMKK